MNNKTQLRWKIVFCLWLVVATTATHVPAMEESVNAVFISPDKLFHFVSFGVLAMTFWCSGWVKQKWLALRLLIVWALLDEITQALLPLGRPFSIADFIASFLGIVSASSWFGALSSPVTYCIREKVDALLSKNIAWFILSTLSILGTISISAIVWYSMWKNFEINNAPASLCVGLLSTLILLLTTIVCWSNIKCKELLVKIVPPLMAVCLISLLIPFLMNGLEIGSWTIGLTFFTIGSSVVWRTIVTADSCERTM
jgi:VanZ family protein